MRIVVHVVQQNGLFVWSLTARQHRMGRFMPTAGELNRLRWLRMANETIRVDGKLLGQSVTVSGMNQVQYTEAS